tara:strand:- start:137 stop:262 length:126 start_codon:yes stop_codon:yes gene_type:complete
MLVEHLVVNKQIEVVVQQEVVVTKNKVAKVVHQSILHQMVL